MSKNEQSHKEKPVSELLQEQSKELKTYIDTKHREMEERRQAFRATAGTYPPLGDPLGDSVGVPLGVPMGSICRNQKAQRWTEMI